MKYDFKRAVALLLALVLSSVMVTAIAESALIDMMSNTGKTQVFTNDAIPKEALNTILNAGAATNDPGNQQPWYFAAITNQDVMKELNSFMIAGIDVQMQAQPYPRNDPSYAYGNLFSLC